MIYYQSYIGGLPPASALSFSHVDVGDAFQIINNIMAERRHNTIGRSGVVVGRWRSNPQVVGLRPASPFSFSDIDVGDAFQIIIHMPVSSCLLSLTYD